MWYVWYMCVCVTYVCICASCSVMSNSFVMLWIVACQIPLWDSLGKNTGVCSHSLFQGIFPTQGLNPDLLHCKWILYQLSHQWSQNVLINLTNYFKRILKTRQTRLNMELLLLSPTCSNWDLIIVSSLPIAEP